MTGSPTITFASLEYEVGSIKQLIANTPNIDSFVFAYYFSATSSALQLVAYAHITEPNRYHINYDVLPVYEDEQPLIASGPLKMCDNVVSAADMETLISGIGDEAADFLVFTPNLNKEHYIYYKIAAYKNALVNSNGKPKRIHVGGPGDVDTNPSPPAT